VSESKAPPPRSDMKRTSSTYEAGWTPRSTLSST
jgi:hypothetical protein